MFCGSCGKQIPDGSGFCPSCGAAAGGGAQPAATGGSGPSAAAAQRAKIEAQLKAGSQDAIAAVKMLLTDPVGGLAKSFASFDAARAQIVGAIFGGVFALAATIAASMMTSLIMGMAAGMMGGGLGMMGGGGFGTGVPFSVYIRVFFLDVIQFVGLVVGCLVTRMIFKSAGSLASDIYVSGACLLPAGLGILAGALLGNISFVLFGLAVLFGGCYCLLMLYSGCLNIGKLSEAKASLSVPIAFCIMLAAVYLGAKIMM